MDYNYAEIIKAAICVMELELGAKGRGCSPKDYQSQRRSGHDWLDWAVDMLKKMPDRHSDRMRIVDYSRGVGSECRIVVRYIKSIPDELWSQGNFIAQNV